MASDFDHERENMDGVLGHASFHGGFLNMVNEALLLPYLVRSSFFAERHSLWKDWWVTVNVTLQSWVATLNLHACTGTSLAGETGCFDQL